MTPVNPTELRRRMVDALIAEKFLTRWRVAFEPWRASLLTVPRHRFLPATVWIDNDGDPPPALVPLHREQDPGRWLTLAYAADRGVITQVDDGRPEGPGCGGSMPTSSASGPIIVAVMLAALDAHEGHRVLEIGTGTGYNAALLAHRLGAEHISTIEIDPDIAAHARAALSDTGFGAVTVATGDGTLGYPASAPYDRVIATAAAHRIPYSWVAQTRPGGRILLPWADTYTGGLLALTVNDDGTAQGSIVAESNFMWLREQREARGAVKLATSESSTDLDRTDARTTTCHPHNVTGPHGARLAISQRVAGCQWRYWPWEPDDPIGVLWLVDPWGSWAKLTHTTPDADEDEFPVLQSGPRRLWDEVEAAYRWWIDADNPDADRWQFTVTPTGQRVQLK
ncbi:MAG TPA: methyltransferase domain-containing protein [Pseudonocardiaceae bacterium]|nr:methyltransferase domain-containing protein [Pseudonocardiaceae bacterium]